MNSFRQIEADRRNALRGTGPTTEEGKRQSRRNAVPHGLTAETVIGGLEDSEDYRAFEAAVIADYDARTAVERELLLRFVSLFWRLRQVIAIETDLLKIQSDIGSVEASADRASSLNCQSAASSTSIVAATISGPMPSLGSTRSVVPERVLVSTKPSSPPSHRFAMRPADAALFGEDGRRRAGRAGGAMRSFRAYGSCILITGFALVALGPAQIHSSPSAHDVGKPGGRALHARRMPGVGGDVPVSGSAYSVIADNWAGYGLGTGVTGNYTSASFSWIMQCALSGARRRNLRAGAENEGAENAPRLFTGRFD